MLQSKKVIITGKSIVETSIVAVSLTKEIHKKLEEIMKKAKTKGINISKQKICKLIVENNIEDVEVQ